MEKAKIELRLNDYMVHFSNDPVFDHIIYFDVYPVSDWTGSDGTSGISYTDKNSNSGDSLDIFDEKSALCKMSGSYCWRGCWEGRLYFPDEEYWSEELSELNDVFSKYIKPFCKDFIKSNHPNADD